ncbi:hypothetical protein [Paenibacillus sp. OK060]|uniref:hypothetical protein n=1 Tax=Paenibacillus sp. OK060 TaxID=1881034 RepID=UPI0015A4E7F6|nr:hypothetical protein [Paenibacillus sp. OK060]
MMRDNSIFSLAGLYDTAIAVLFVCLRKYEPDWRTTDRRRAIRGETHVTLLSSDLKDWS